ncbi:MAG: ribosome maturation factor RimM [Bacteroidales bacterium]|nr:ribosome maturation factor RimM [Bacteroidales bacterium]
MIKREELISIGQFNKPHGINGELSFTFTDDVFDRTHSPYFVCEMDGIFVPFFIEEYRFRSENGALIKLKNITTEEQAKQFIKKEIFFPKSFLPEDEEPETASDYFIGYTIIDKNHGEIGVIKEIEDSTINVLFVVKRKKEEFLIPASNEYVCEIDDVEKTILMDIPEGLLEMQNDQPSDDSYNSED